MTTDDLIKIRIPRSLFRALGELELALSSRSMQGRAVPDALNKHAPCKTTGVLKACAHVRGIDAGYVAAQTAEVPRKHAEALIALGCVADDAQTGLADALKASSAYFKDGRKLRPIKSLSQLVIG